jgi:hypothetical protein
VVTEAASVVVCFGHVIRDIHSLRFSQVTVVSVASGLNVVSGLNVASGSSVVSGLNVASGLNVVSVPNVANGLSGVAGLMAIGEMTKIVDVAGDADVDVETGEVSDLEYYLR